MNRIGQSSHDDMLLAQNAAEGDSSSRRYVSELLQPLITRQTKVFCRRFCRDNYRRFQCTLFTEWIKSAQDKPLCEWGNASYAWMLDELAKPDRLRKYSAQDNARLIDYLFVICNSLPFYERWKDWRFGRRDRVPTYIQDLHPDAGKIFLHMRRTNETDTIAMQLGLDKEDVEAIAGKVIVELTQRRRLHILQAPATVSLVDLNTKCEEGEAKEADIPYTDNSAEDLEISHKIHDAWKQLDAVEQFVLEAMVIEEQDANDVLQTLKSLGISLKPNTPAEHMDRQQLYYFRRKTIAKLAGLSRLGEV